MSILKPVPDVPQVVRKVCPYCGKPSYSRDGVHPQCSLTQADAARNARIREQRKREQEKATASPAPRYHSKKCPGCGTHVHIRVGACACGHKFATARR